MSIAVELRGPRNTAFAADNNSLLIDEGIYRTPSCGYWLLNYGELVRAPRKRKIMLPSLRLSGLTMETSKCGIRKRLDFDSVLVESCNTTSSTDTVDCCNTTSTDTVDCCNAITSSADSTCLSEKKLEPNGDTLFERLHSNVANPLQESTFVKKVKFADNCKTIDIDSPKSCSSGNSVTPSFLKDNTLQKKEGEEDASSDWEVDFFTPITDPSYRSGPKPDLNHSVTPFTCVTNFLNGEDSKSVNKKRARKISFSSDTAITFPVGIKRSKSARSLTFH